jgi:hypothetical protein
MMRSSIAVCVQSTRKIQNRERKYDDENRELLIWLCAHTPYESRECTMHIQYQISTVRTVVLPVHEYMREHTTVGPYVSQCHSHKSSKLSDSEYNKNVKMYLATAIV